MKVSRHTGGRIFAATMILTACASLYTGCGNAKREQIAKQREDWALSLQDTLKNLQTSRTNDSIALEEAREKVSREIEQFTFVENPREVEGYYIYTPFRSSYPLKSTGLCARVLKNEGLELVAAGKSRFSAIRATAGDATAETEVVPADQALNYTVAGLTTVAFTGAKADSLAMLIASAEGTPVKIEYLNPSVTATYTLSPQQCEEIAATWSLYHNRCRTHLLEKSIANTARKIEATRITVARMADEDDKKK